MQLDRTEIEIRQRSALELLDLSLRVFNRHWARLILAGALQGLPMMVLNLSLIGWMLSDESILIADGQIDPMTAVGSRYLAHLIVLFCSQLPLMFLPVTLLLGAQVFYQPLTTGQLLAQVRRLWIPVIGILGFLRLGLVPLLMEPLVDRSVEFDATTEVLTLFVFFPLALFTRTFWPYAPEIIVLERCPLRSKQVGTVNYSARRQMLHGSMVAENLVYFLQAALFGGLLVAMLMGSTLFVQAMLTGSWQLNWGMYVIAFPACLWLVGIFMSVFRFLTYIDTRIRLEGWEIDLIMRAEGQRLLDTMQPTSGRQLSTEGASTA
jgi:hypothetical protein